METAGMHLKIGSQLLSCDIFKGVGDIKHTHSSLHVALTHLNFFLKTHKGKERLCGSKFFFSDEETEAEK